MHISDVLIQLAAITSKPTPTASPGDPTAQANLELSNFYIAVIILFLAVVVIVISLVFAFKYHAKVLGVIATDVRKNRVPVEATNSEVEREAVRPGAPDPSNAAKTPAKKVPAAGTTPSVPAIVLPFVIANWGRLVIVIFGVGVISALMTMKILDAAAGIGILGTLLGVGAVSATTGATGTTGTSADSTKAPED